MIILFNSAGSGDSGEELFMKDEKTLAYINLFAILGALPYLCDLDRKSAQLIENANVSVGFAVKGGPLPRSSLAAAGAAWSPAQIAVR